MLLIPAIDIKAGRCVRLRQGDMQQESIYSEDPLSVAERWVSAGARRLHIVDLDGAVSGQPENATLIRSIAETHTGLEIQVGGGIRNEDAIQAYLDVGVNYVIIGTRAVATPHFVADACVEFPGHIIVGLDAKDGKLATDGWSKLSQHTALDMARRFEDAGVSALIFTDIGRDGMLNHINIAATVALCRELVTPVIAAGGLRDLEDVRALCAVTDEGIVGAITGKAIYEGSLDFAEAQALAQSLCDSVKTPQDGPEQ